MNRRKLLAGGVALGALGLWPGSGSLAARRVAAAGAGEVRAFHDVGVPAEALRPLDRDPEVWRTHLEEDAWDILFRAQTERAFSSPLDRERRDGTFVCAACHLPLFSSATKYDSGTGWPSFYAPFPERFGTQLDLKMIWPRTEYHCVRCGGHHGHVFEDGPEPTGQRWCNNGVALRFVAAGDALPDLRG